MLELADLSLLDWCALSNSADGLQLLIFWQMVQCHFQSALVTGTFCFIAPSIAFDQNLIEIDQNPMRLTLFSAAVGTNDVIGAN